MRVAVLSLTRDRLPYTVHCFGKLRELAGCDYDHLVLDQGSTDGTAEWLREEYKPFGVVTLTENVGVSRGMNVLLDIVATHEPYDVIVKFDNDAELLAANTLQACCLIAWGGGWITSPHIQGLDHPPVVEREELLRDHRTGEVWRIGIPNIMGGIFMAAPASLYATYRHDENNPIWGMDDAKIVDHWRALGGEVGYLLDYPANHYLSTAGQRADNVGGYYTRKEREFSGR